MFGRVLLLVALAVALSACGGTSSQQRQPVSVDDGIQLVGRLAEQPINISDGAPLVLIEDCDANDGRDLDLCIVARTIDGQQLNVVIENPAALRAGESLRVERRDCHPAACDSITDVAIVEVRLDGVPFRASGGELVMTAADPRFSASIRLTFGGPDRLTGAFDVIETPPEER